MRFFATPLLALLLPFAATAQTHDHGSMMGTTITQNGTRGPVVSFKSGSETVQAELYLGMGKQRAASPALILIHEWWGLNDWVRDQARSLASSGYTVLTIDLYRGQAATDAETAHELMRGLPHDRAIRDLEGAVAYLRTVTGANAKIGVVGWCMGGGYAIDLAVVEPNLQAVVVNYGALPTDKDTLAKIQAPVLGNFGGQDKGITPAMVDDFTSAMQSLHKQVDIKEYPDTGHAFQNETNKTGYNAADTIDAKRRTLLFLSSQLKR
jgi:carboxymethylenebutenolidase